MNDPFAALYAALSIYHNLDDRFAMQSDKWHGWASELHAEQQHIPDLIQFIRRGQMRDIMRNHSIPTLDDIRHAIRTIKRDKRRDTALQALPSPQQRKNIHDCLETLKQSYVTPEDYASPTGQWSRDSWDSYLDRKYPRNARRHRH